MFMRESKSDEPAPAHGRLTWGGLAVASVLTILIGLLPGPIIDVVDQAARAIGT
jgi:hypothetical protein